MIHCDKGSKFGSYNFEIGELGSQLWFEYLVVRNCAWSMRLTMMIMYSTKMLRIFKMMYMMNIRKI